jgi:tripartite-type tricarboxylate transporter receptor subunit TctC
MIPFVRIAAIAVLLHTGADARAQRPSTSSGHAFPERPLRVIVPFPSGSAPDNVTRILGPQITANTGQPVIVDSRAGAAGTLATDLGAKATPDGYTVTFAVLGPVGLAPSLYAKLPYDSVKDFAPVTLIAFAPQILMTSPSSPFKSVKELIAAARAKPGQLTYASAGSGTLPHLSAERFSRLADIRLLHVPYKGVAAALPDLMAGRANVAFGNIATGLPHVKSGKLVGLAVTSAARASQLPDTPTLAEAANLPGFEMNDWFGALVPAATPKPVVDQLHGIIVKALAAPEVKAQLANFGVQPTTMTPAEFAKFIRSEIVRWAEVIKASGARAE